MNIKKTLALAAISCCFLIAQAQKNKPIANTPSLATVWSFEKANAWYNKHPSITGANFISSNAINKLEMWQAETFDSVTLNRELQWGVDMGFNTIARPK